MILEPQLPECWGVEALTQLFLSISTRRICLVYSGSDPCRTLKLCETLTHPETMAVAIKRYLWIDTQVVSTQRLAMGSVYNSITYTAREYLSLLGKGKRLTHPRGIVEHPCNLSTLEESKFVASLSYIYSGHMETLSSEPKAGNGVQWWE